MLSSTVVTPRLGAAAGSTAATAVSSAAGECKSGGLHPPSSASMNDFVRQVRGRIRYFSVCGPGSDIGEDVRKLHFENKNAPILGPIKKERALLFMKYLAVILF